MRHYVACIILFLTTICHSFGQAYKYISVTEGLSDRRVLSIQKDKAGFMWFLTYTGIDRYDGKNIKHYRLQSSEGYISFYSEKNILKTDSQGQIWTIGPGGELFKYDPLIDQFTQIQLPTDILSSKTLNLVKMTDFDEVWYCHNNHCYVYDLKDLKLKIINIPHQHKFITSICQTDKETYYIGTNDGICKINLRNGVFPSSECLIPNEYCQLPHVIYIHPASNRLFAGSETTGLIVYDLTLGKVEKQYKDLKDFPITSFHAYDKGQILIPTRGAGVQMYDLQKGELVQYLHANYHEPNKMNGNNIRALYIDNHQRIWMSVYARSITVYDRTLPDYKWFKNHIGNTHSLNDDLVNAIMEDSDGDIWFATNNGISLYRTSDHTWSHLFPWEENLLESMKNTIFLSLCETEPGTIVTGGFMTGVYSINKKTLEARLLTPQIYTPDINNPTLTNKYIRAIHRDNEGIVWTGGNNYLGRTNNRTKEFNYYRIGSAITCMVELPPHTLLIGTGDGIYKLNKKTGKVEKMRMPFASQQINCMYMHPKGDLYVGTTNSGLVILRTDGTYEIYIQKNSALLSNTINTIVPKNETEIIVATDHNIALYRNHTKEFTNWTEDQGLINTNFNPRAGIHSTRGTFIFGSNNGAVEWKDDMKLPHQEKTEIFFDQILIENQHVSHNTINRANVHSLDSINELQIGPNQQTIAIHISTIDYNNPQYTYFQWKLTERYDYWSKLSKDNWLQFRNLKPGEYILTIQNVASEDYRILGERRLRIIIQPTFWQTKEAWLVYLLCCIIIFFIIFRYIWYKREQKISSENNKVLIETVHNIRTPLTLAQNSIKEVIKQQELASQSYNYLQTASYSVEKLNIMVMNLLNVEKIRKNRRLQMKIHDVNKLVRKSIRAFASFIEINNITIQFMHQEEEKVRAWIDATQIELILYNLLSNLLRQTRPNRVIYLSVYKDQKRWGINISNSHDFMLVSPQLHAPDKHFRHINIKELDTELSLIRQLVKRHHGLLEYMVIPSANYLFNISFPIRNPLHINHNQSDNSDEEETSKTFTPLPEHPKLMTVEELNIMEKMGSILVVDESQTAIDFLQNSLCMEWKISSTRSAAIALELIKEHEPDIIIISSDVAPIGGIDLCTILKSYVDTSHIPIILVISDDEKDTLQDNFVKRADHYVTKPYDLFVIKTILSNILENREQLQKRLRKVDKMHNLKNIKQANVEQETKFLTEVKQVINDHANDANFGVDDLCAVMGMSRTNLYNKIKLLTNQSPNTLIRDARMKCASEMLLSGKYNITEVCDLMGYSELKYFREVFKNFYGINPSDYIKLHKKKIKEKN